MNLKLKKSQKNVLNSMRKFLEKNEKKQDRLINTDNNATTSSTVELTASHTSNKTPIIKNNPTKKNSNTHVTETHAKKIMNYILTNKGVFYYFFYYFIYYLSQV
jgi:hypothetical protein